MLTKNLQRKVNAKARAMERRANRRHKQTSNFESMLEFIKWSYDNYHCKAKVKVVVPDHLV